jgi:hypothetical protein
LASAQSATQRYICFFIQPQATELRLEFVLDLGTGRAFMVGNAGLSPVISCAGTAAVTFVELLSSGAVQTTSIVNSGVAIHSRHTVMSNSFVSSQLNGSCQ